MKKVYIFSEQDSLIYSQQIEKYLNNPKIEILAIDHQVSHQYVPVRQGSKTVLNSHNIYTQLVTTYTAFITYREV